MGSHLRANLWLLVLTVLLCCVLYPLALWAVGQAAFHEQAEGSLIYKADGKTVVGSRLIGQPFSDERYFWPRPSAPAMATTLRRQVGPISRRAIPSSVAGSPNSSPRWPTTEAANR